MDVKLEEDRNKANERVCRMCKEVRGGEVKEGRKEDSSETKARRRGKRSKRASKV